jgi:hypothetical protein
VAALIVAAGVIIIAGALAMTGKQQFQEALPPTPAQALDGLRRDVGVVKESARRA